MVLIIEMFEAGRMAKNAHGHAKPLVFNTLNPSVNSPRQVLHYATV